MQDGSLESLLGPLNETERKYAPKQLFAAGDVGLLKRRPRVSLIGSRKASPEALELTRELSEALVARGAVVVSGLARGIDTAAHVAAIESGGSTIAVLGTPLTRCYPSENQALQDRMAREQLVVSQFPPERPTQRKDFPIRNRTMALLSEASVIVTAQEKSGTEHQGWEALRLGRILFIEESLRELSWVQKMLEYGAILYSGENFPAFLEELLPPAPVEELRELPF